MIRELWKKLWEKIGRGSGQSEKNGRLRVSESLKLLQESYRDLCRLANQIEAHAQRAPYPYVADCLRKMAQEKHHTATALKERILSKGGDFKDSELELKSGKNHWERMVRDLEDQRALETTLLERAFRLAEEFPDISDLLKNIALAQASHKETLINLLARSDPQAHQS